MASYESSGQNVPTFNISRGSRGGGGRSGGGRGSGRVVGSDTPSDGGRRFDNGPSDGGRRFDNGGGGGGNVRGNGNSTYHRNDRGRGSGSSQSYDDNYRRAGPVGPPGRQMGRGTRTGGGIRQQQPYQNSDPTCGRPRRISSASTSSDVEYSDKNCIVCYKEVKYYSVGACDHSVCYECSGRMRVLMEQNECPICRQTLENVIFTKGRKSFKELKDKLRMFILLPQWSLYLEGDEVHKDFENLLEHRCQYCKEEDDMVFSTFRELKSHIHRVHELYACDLCSEHIKLFSKERRFYTRQELATHKRKGDKNDKSHRGHPMCEFCDRRYFDHDELYKHLRKDHYFCHFCDADGYNHYYNTYDDLRLHFKKEHFLCEEENCKDEKFTSVFRSDIDMKAHLTVVHFRLLGKHGTKQARMIDLEFNIKSDDDRRTRRFNVDGVVSRGGRRERGGEDDGQSRECDDISHPYFEPTIHAQPKVDSVADFPMLEGAAATPVLTVTNGSSHANSSIAQKVALSSGKNVVNKQSSGSGVKWNAKVTGSSRHDEEFPALGPESNLSQPVTTRPFVSTTSTVLSVKQPQLPVSTSQRNGFARPVTLSSAMEEFPSLGNPSTSKGSAWVGSGVKTKGKVTPRTLKVARPPLERKVEVDPFDDFHFVPLSVSRARKDSLTEKYESIIAEEDLVDDGADVDGKDKLKKKKKSKNDSSSNNNSSNNEKVKAAAALFNSGKVSKDKENSGANSKLLSTTDFKDDFPSLEPIKKSLSPPSPKSSSSPKSNPQVHSSGEAISGGSPRPPPGFGSSKPPPPQEDLFDISFLTATNGNNNKNKKNHNNNTISEDLELLKAKAGSSGKLYIQPPEFTRRNGRLLEAVKSSLNRDESSFEMFKSVSNQYRKGELNSKEYYELCQDMFGISDYRIIFPELLALLPEIEKQQELLSAHRRAGGLMKDLTSCHECFQVVKTGDMSAHIQSHSADELFPAL